MKKFDILCSILAWFSCFPYEDMNSNKFLFNITLYDIGLISKDSINDIFTFVTHKS